VQTAVTELARLGELEVGYQEGPKGCNRYRVVMDKPPANFAPPPQSLRGAESAPPQNLRGTGETEDSQVKAGDPANFAPPPQDLHPAESAGDPANFAPGTVKEPSENSPTESSPEGDAGGDDPTLFGDGVAPPPKRPRRQRKSRPESHPRFDEWYAAYPLHQDRGDAEKAYAEVVAKGADPDDLLAGAIRYQDDPKVKNGYTKGPARWLRAKCWLDEPAPPRGQSSANGHKSSGGHQSFQNPTDPDAYKGTF
jgi:hypothetical protein